MSTYTETNSPKDIFSLYQQNADKMLSAVRKSVPQYHQAVTNTQQEYLQACESLVSSAISMQKEFARKAGVASSVPEASIKAIQSAMEQILKAAAVQNHVAITAINTAQQNIKVFSENAKALADINKNIADSWVSFLTARK